MSDDPIAVQVRMYNVGFGDCFLLTFRYSTSSTRPERHLLIDCGSTKYAAGIKMDKIVDDICTQTGGRLDVLVVTHRHKDHLSAFGTDRNAPLLEALAPAAVIRPWVDDPDAPKDADEGTANFLRALRLSQKFAADLEDAIHVTRAGVKGGRQPELLLAAGAQRANDDAIRCLDRLSQSANDDGLYLSASPTPRHLAQLPGVTLHVLGPPTYKQLPDARKASANYDGRYWLSQTALLEKSLELAGLTSRDAQAAARATLEARDADLVTGPASWLITKMQERHDHALQRVVEVVDGALNNTSLILLIQVGNKKMLFPGDAQGENWSWALDHAPDQQRAEWRQLLTDIDLYKVGHHGSRNATPRPLYEWWVSRGRELTSLLSTERHKHHNPGTEVPRKTLVAKLQDLGTLISTDTTPHPLSLGVEASTTETTPFRLVT